MENAIEVRFPEGKKIDAMFEGFTVYTDQKPDNGGGGTAPEPFKLFLVSIATCAGIYALEFCLSRKLPTRDMSLTMRYEMNQKGRICEKVHIDLRLPSGFPEKYKKAMLRVMDLCSVKKNIMNPPEFEITAH